MKDAWKIIPASFFMRNLSYMVIIIYDNFQSEKTFLKNFFCFKFILSKLVMIEPSTNS